MRPERFELPTCCSGGNRSIQLSYGRTVSSVYMRREGGAIGAGARIQGLGSRGRGPESMVKIPVQQSRRLVSRSRDQRQDSECPAIENGSG